MASEIGMEYLSLPISNEYNKELERDIDQKQNEIKKFDQQISEHNDRIQILSDHLKNVYQELQLSQALYEARKNDVETEKHLIQVAEREEGRLKDGYRHLKHEEEKLSERMNMFENSIFKSKTKMEEIRKDMNLDQQALESWLEESARRDEDSSIILKYAKADDNKIKGLTLKSEQLHADYIKARRSLDIETTNTLTAQIELDKTAESFRLAHNERQQLILQWEQIIEQMKRRDEDMDRTATELARLKAELKTMQTLVNEKKQFLEDEMNNNRELDKRVRQAESQSAKCHTEHQEKEREKQQLRDELETLKYSVDRTAADLESLRSQSHYLSKEIKDQKIRLDTVHHQRLIMAEEHKKAIQKTLSAEERAYKMDQILAEEEIKVKKLEKELSVLRDRQFKKNQDLHEVKRKKQNIEAEIQSSRVAKRNLLSKQRMIDEETLKQQELLYTQDFQLQQLEHKLSRIEGERTEEEKTHLNEKIKELESQWESQHQSEILLRNQSKRLQDDLRRIIIKVNKGHNDKDILIGKINELNLHIDNTKRELKKATTAKQDLMVDENIIKLELKRLRDILFTHSGEIVGLEKEKLQLAMTERKKDIDVHKEMLKSQIKTLDSERQTVNTELHERISKIDRLRKRYELITVSMSSPEGEEEHSQTYYVIKAAQEREEIQREGDELDAKIRKAEKEIQALENTLLLMNSKNEKFRKSIQHFDPKGDESIEMETIEGQLKAAMNKYRHKKKQVSQLETDIKALTNTLNAVIQEQTTSVTSLENTKEQLSTLTKEIDEIKMKLGRATKQSTKLIKELRSRKGNADKIDVEDDIELRELRDFNANILQQLGKIASNDPKIFTMVQLLLSQVGLSTSLPTSPSNSKTSSALSSARSSTTQLTPRSSRQSTPRQLLQAKPLELGVASFEATTPPSVHSSTSSRRSSIDGRQMRSSPSSSIASSRPSSSRSDKPSS